MYLAYDWFSTWESGTSSTASIKMILTLSPGPWKILMLIHEPNCQITMLISCPWGLQCYKIDITSSAASIQMVLMLTPGPKFYIKQSHFEAFDMGTFASAELVSLHLFLGTLNVTNWSFLLPTGTDGFCHTDLRHELARFCVFFFLERGGGWLLPAHLISSPIVIWLGLQCLIVFLHVSWLGGEMVSCRTDFWCFAKTLCLWGTTPIATTVMSCW